MISFRSRIPALGAAVLILVSASGCRLIGPLVGSLGSMAVALAPLKLMFLCIPEGTEIDTPGGPRPIELIRPGDEVIGFEGSPVKVRQIQGYLEDPTTERFLEIEFENGSSVRLCDMHRLDHVRANILKPGDRIGGQVVTSVEVFSGVERSYDLLTDDAGYRISGIPVNSMIEEMYEAGRSGVESIRE